MKKVLVVDDDESIRCLLSQLLGEQYHVSTAENGAEAVALARSLKPDLILMDIMMPEMDGYTACSIMKSDKITKQIPVVMLTGVGYDMNRELAARVGADGYLTKPLTLNILLDTVKQFLTES